MKSSLQSNRILHLTLKAKPFEVMLKGEKRIEFRQPSKWLLSRLAPTKNYELIKFVNGYGNDKPFFIAKYLGWEFHNEKSTTQEYSNGLRVDIEKGIIKISIGEIAESGNLNNK